uniref:Uncharacterized protein n=1 Tax=Setaria italica TaxID=4555 RepID=K3ZPK4_SETIT
MEIHTSNMLFHFFSVSGTCLNELTTCFNDFNAYLNSFSYFGTQ